MDSHANIQYNFAKKHQTLLVESQGRLQLFISPTTALDAIAEVQRVVQQEMSLEELDQITFNQTLVNFYSNKSSTTESIANDLGDDINLLALAESIPNNADLMDQEDEAPIIRLINAMLSEAIKLNASDIHLETFDDEMSVRFRVDGILRHILSPKKALYPLLVSRIKVMAKMDIAEKRLPQDGRISLKLGGKEIDVRVSTIPSNESERIVLRLLEKQVGRLSFLDLGMSPEDDAKLTDLLHKPHGIILVTGPTGSGKTTTLYAGMQTIQSTAVNILTVEDPVEYNLKGIGQTQVNLKAGMTFAKGLRAILRQDPDVVMVGEIRDVETAQIAIQASLTGHLVLSTLHTNTAAGAITRLMDMDIEPFLLSSSLLGILSQRLVRVLCPHCKYTYIATDKDCNILHLPIGSTLYKPKGCDNCNHQGYKGRTGIYELIVITESIRALIHDRSAETEVIKAARRAGPNIFSDGKAKVLAGLTSIDEVLRVAQDF